MNEFNLELFDESVKENKTGLIIGNGFSMNFDSQFGNIYNLLEDGIHSIKKIGEFSIAPDAKPLTRRTILSNYNKVLNYLGELTQKELEKIFEDAVLFAGFITENNVINTYLRNLKYTHMNSYKIGPNMLEITEDIYKVGSAKGFKYTNIEHWPILIWLFNLIQYHNEFINYKKRQLNEFINILELGSQSLSPKNSPGDVMVRTRINGFYILYRNLMTTIVFGNGKAVDKKKLQNINNICKESLTNWLNNFNVLISMNYDHILSQFTNKEITYPHGRFVANNQKYTFFQSYRLSYNGVNYYTNNIILGDYITSKVMDPFIKTISMKNFMFSEPPVETLDEIKKLMDSFHLNHIVFFGLNPENDYHILSGIFSNFLLSKTESPTITFCYYNPVEIEQFRDIFNHVVKTIYPKHLYFLDKIKFNFMDSKEVIGAYFRK